MYICILLLATYFALQECNEFLAGHALRSQSRFSALSETAVMGVVCRHEFPLCFINLFHGERYHKSISYIKCYTINTFTGYLTVCISLNS